MTAKPPEPELRHLDNNDAQSRLSKSIGLREADPRIFDPAYSIEERRAFLAAVRRQQRGAA